MSDYPSLFRGFLSHFSSHIPHFYEVTWLIFRHFIQIKILKVVTFSIWQFFPHSGCPVSGSMGGQGSYIPRVIQLNNITVMVSRSNHLKYSSIFSRQMERDLIISKRYLLIITTVIVSRTNNLKYSSKFSRQNMKILNYI